MRVRLGLGLREGLRDVRPTPRVRRGRLTRSKETGADRGDHDPDILLPIDAPISWDDYDAIRWYLAHGSTSIYIRKKTWHLLVKSGSEAVADDNQFEKIFETAEQLWEYAEAVLPPRKRPKPTGPTLTVISPASNP